MLPNLTVEPTTTAPQFDGIAELPRVTPVRRALQNTGGQLRVGTSAKATHARYQDAINVAAPGDRITAEAGFVTDESFVLTDKPGFVELVGEPGAVILASGAGGSISCADGASHWHLADLEVKPDGVIRGGYGLITIAPPGERTAQSQPHDIVLERITCHADPLKDFFRRGLFLIARGVQVLDSSFVGFNDANNSDSQGILYLGGDGQSLFDGVTASAVSECLLFGGGDSPYTLGDVTVRGLRLFKDPAWIGRDECTAVKNLLELKLGLRMLFEDLTLEHCWNGPTGWQGLAVAMKTVNQDGAMAHAQTGHVTLRRATIAGVGSGFGLHPNPEAQKPCVPMAHVSIHDVTLDLDTSRGNGHALAFGGKTTDVEFRKNTVRSGPQVGYPVCITAGEGGAGKMERVHVTDNLFDMPGANALQGDSFGYVDNNLDAYWDASCSLERNEFRNIGPTRHTSPRAATNVFPDAAPIAAPAPTPPPVPPVLGLPTSSDQKAMLAALARLEAAVAALTGAIAPLIAQAQGAAQAHADLAAAEASVASIAARVEGVVASIAPPVS